MVVAKAWGMGDWETLVKKGKKWGRITKRHVSKLKSLHDLTELRIVLQWWTLNSEKSFRKEKSNYNEIQMEDTSIYEKFFILSFQ